MTERECDDPFTFIPGQLALHVGDAIVQSELGRPQCDFHVVTACSSAATTAI